MTKSKVFGFLRDVDAIHGLAFIGGLYDAAGYILLQGIFTSSITGNLIVAISSVSSTDGIIGRSVTCVAFLLAGAISALIALGLKLMFKYTTRMVSALLFTLQVVVMIMALVLGRVYRAELDRAVDANEYHVVLVGAVMGVAMGIHNVAAKEAIANCPATTVMTSTMITVGSNFSNTIGYYIASKSVAKVKNGATEVPTTESNVGASKALEDKYLDSREKFLTTVKPLLFFVAGALVGAAVADHGSFWFSLIPIFLVTVIVVDILIVEYQSLPKKAANEGNAGATPDSVVEMKTSVAV